jgi:diguanylate cyclase (GGDEF)-like protein
MLHGSLLTWTERSDRLPVAVRVGVVGVALGVVTVVDWATGPDLLMTFPYSLCVMAAAWFVSRTWGLGLALVAAVTGLVVRIASERQESWTVLGANTVLRSSSFLLFALLTASVRRGVDDLVTTARLDPMTGILSRQGFLDALAASRRRVERSAAPLGVVYFDLDGLKRVNDQYGHAAGDQLIQRFVDRAARHLRSTDAFGRLGGDEFAIVLERAEPEVIDAVVERVLDDPGLPDVSCGVAVFAGEYPSPAQMLAGADRRMYRDKQVRRGLAPPS